MCIAYCRFIARDYESETITFQLRLHPKTANDKESPGRATQSTLTRKKQRSQYTLKNDSENIKQKDSRNHNGSVTEDQASLVRTISFASIDEMDKSMIKMQKRKKPIEEIQQQQQIPSKKKRTNTCSLGVTRVKALPHRQASRLQLLPDDILYYLARTFLWEPTEIFDLARTSRSLWAILERDIYMTDVYAVRYYHHHHVNVAAARGLLPRPAAAFPPRTSLLHWAALAGRTDMVSKALAAARMVWDGYVDFQHAKCGHAAIHFAAHYGRLEVVRALRRESKGNKKPSSTSSSSLSSLCTTAPLVDMTAASGWTCPAPQRLHSILQRLTPGRFRVPPEYMLQDEGYPFKIDALGLAILKGHCDVAMYLLESMYDERRLEQERIFPPFHLAAFVGMVEVVEAILSRGSTGVNTVCKHVANSMVMHWAAAGSGGNDKRGLMTLNILRRAGVDMTARDAVGRTPLDWAIGFKKVDNALYLLKRSVRLSPTHNHDLSDHHHHHHQEVEEWTKRLQRCMADDVLLECTKFILERCCPDLPEECLKLCAQSTFWDIDRSSSSSSWDDEAGRPSSSSSTASKNLATKRWLVENDIGLGVLSKGVGASWMQEELFQGRSFLHYAAGSTDVDAELLAAVLARVLRRSKDEINLIDAKGLTPLELALGYRCVPEKVQLLLRAGANPALCYGGERARADVDRQIEQLSLEEALEGE